MEYELACRRDADAAAEAEHRHGDGTRAAAAIVQDVRTDPSSRPTATRRSWTGWRRRAGRVRRAADGDEGAPSARRPRPRDDVPRRRRRHAVERGPRLRAAPDHPPRRPPGSAGSASTSSGGSATWSSSRWAVVPGADRAPRADPGRVRAEEERFTETLARGMKLFEEVAAAGAISGKDAFDLTATYGFPFELTTELALERGIPVDEDGYRERMAEHREVVARRRVERAASVLPGPPAEFVGYDQTEVLTAIVALNDLGDGTFEAKLERSPFYPAGGGQVSRPRLDRARRTRARAPSSAMRSGSATTRYSSSKERGLPPATVSRRSSPGRCAFRRWRTTRLRTCCTRRCGDVLGEHVQQAGSAVRPDKLRFDFTHEQALSARGARPGRAARQRAGLRRTPGPDLRDADRRGAAARRPDALRREVRRDVRVVEIDGFSRELCGGTHVRSTAEIGPFVILSEGSVGSGARRIEAITSGEAFALLHERAREGDALRGELAKVRKEAKQGGDGKADAADFTVTRETAAGDVTVLVVEVDGGRSARRLRQAEATARACCGHRRPA